MKGLKSENNIIMKICEKGGNFISRGSSILSREGRSVSSNEHFTARTAFILHSGKR